MINEQFVFIGCETEFRGARVSHRGSDPGCGGEPIVCPLSMRVLLIDVSVWWLKMLLLVTQDT
jgi:hypothetical protein